MSDAIWVVGGQQRGVTHWTKEWNLYKKALVVKAEGGRVQVVLEYQSPPEHCAEGSPAILFKAASIQGDRAYLCTQTEVLICEFPSFAIRQIISLPCFNDVHHVAVAPDGRLFVAVTGLDAVAELAPDGTLLQLVSVVGGSVWDRFSPMTDYRKVMTTKPHLSHPNFIFFLDGEPWVTRFQQRDAVPLNGKANGRAAFRVGMEGIHDGYVTADHVYFTVISGFIVRFDLTSGRMQSFDLNKIDNARSDRPLGWCRGILPLGDKVWVGFSRIRYTTLRHNLDWIRRGFRHAGRYPPAPTRIACYDFQNQTVVDQINLESAAINTVFSIHAG
ncbi:MAG: hypothetical protein ABSA68_14170 [Xanthobacteraceae bacterium]|jgi:hypothetical protein